MNEEIIENEIEEIDERKDGAVERIMKLLKKKMVYAFRDQLDEIYITIELDGSTIMNIDSPDFYNWIVSFLYKNLKNTSNDSTIKTVIKILKHEAIERHKEYLSVRVASFGPAICYDLGNERFVFVNAKDWWIEEKPKVILFRRFKHQKEQVEPERGGNIRDFLQFTNVKSREDEILLLVYLVVAYIPGFPHPPIITHGSQGSAKSTLSRLLKDLIDPSSLETTSVNDDGEIKDFIQTASHHWIIFLDNVSFLSNRLSDVISRICTGGGLSKRRHYTNDDDFIYNFKHIIGINGINQVASRPDLLDRSVLINLERISEERRVTEEELWRRYYEMKPKILGAIFTSVSGTMREYENVKINSLPRMADFAKWGCAAAKALGLHENDFLNAYFANQAKQNQEAVSASAVATAILSFMENRAYSEESPSELYKELDLIAEDLKVKDHTDWPKAASWLWKRIEYVIPNLASEGIKVERTKDKIRKIILRKDAGPNNKDNKTEETAIPPLWGI